VLRSHVYLILHTLDWEIPLFKLINVNDWIMIYQPVFFCCGNSMSLLANASIWRILMLENKITETAAQDTFLIVDGMLIETYY